MSEARQSARGGDQLPRGNRGLLECSRRCWREEDDGGMAVLDLGEDKKERVMALGFMKMEVDGERAVGCGKKWRSSCHSAGGCCCCERV